MGITILQSKKQYAATGIAKNPAIIPSRTNRVNFSLKVATIHSFSYEAASTESSKPAIKIQLPHSRK